MTTIEDMSDKEVMETLNKLLKPFGGSLNKLGETLGGMSKDIKKEGEEKQ